jgi:hypothetical protein
MNWGKATFWVLAGFVAVSLLALAFIMVFENEELVEKDYYEQELNYQNRIEASKNFELLLAKPIIEVKNQSLSIQLMQGSGFARLLNLKNSELDTTIGLKAGKPSVVGLSNGKWRLSLNWEENKKSYFFEKSLLIEKLDTVVK